MDIFKHILSFRAVVCLTGAVCLIGVGGALVPAGHTYASGMSSGTQEPTHTLHYPQAVDVFYTQKPLGQFWIRGIGNYQPRAQALINLLDGAWAHGLNPQSYHLDVIRAGMESPEAMDRGTLDRLMTDAAIRYARDLTGMRAQNQIQPSLRAFWRQPMDPEKILTLIAAASDPIAALRTLEPKGRLYTALKAELKRLAALEGDLPPIDPPKKAIHLGDSAPIIPALRARFGVTAGDSPVYDDALAAKIVAFQHENSLKADGVINKSLIEAVNKPRAARMKQVIANMERLRWLDQTRPDRYILVNIPSATLWAVENGAVSLEMPVIVGKKARPTYSFKADITGIRLNPNWTVPPTIKKKDFLPMLKENPHALSKRGIELIHNGQTIDPQSIDWHDISSRDLHSIKMVQAPGAENPLGRVRVIMDNPFGIYLHDTNNRTQFDDDDRLLSSGCIRVSKPEELAAFILQGTPDWTLDRVNASIDSGRMRDIKTHAPVSVYITYQTMWFDSQGRLIYGDDVYGQDEKLVGYLLKSGESNIPENISVPEISL